MSTIKPIHLAVNELDYELRIRGVVTQKEVVKRQKILQLALDRESQKVVHLSDPEFNFDTEKDAVNNSIDSINGLVLEFEGNENDAAYKRIKSRLSHLSGRILRIPCAPEEIDINTFKKESYATCLEMEAELEDRVKQNNLNNTATLNLSNVTSVSYASTSSQKAIPVYKWGITFDGESSSSLLAFLDRVDELSIARHVDKADLFPSAVDLFSGKALMWFRSIRNSVNDWDSLVALLKKDFLSENYDDDLWEEIRNRQQGRNEPITIFIAQMETLFNRLSKVPSELTKVKYIKKSLLPYYVRQLALSEINTVTELHQLCRRLETASQVSNRVKTNCKLNLLETENASVDTDYASHTTVDKKNHRPRNDNKKSISCWNCHQPNHTYQHCTLKRNKFCYKCGKANVTTASCPSCSENR